MQTLDTPSEVSSNNSMNINEIMAMLPHRFPFLLLDRVTHIEMGKWIEGYKNVAVNEPYFTGHFPENPIMPGVMIVEALAQIASIMVMKMPFGAGRIGLFAGIDGFRFRKPVVPGDKLMLRADLLRLKGPIGKAHCTATVDGQMAAEGDILFTIVDPTRKYG